MTEEASRLTILQPKTDGRSDFEKDFEDDTLFQLQSRAEAKRHTRKFSPEDYVDKAKHDFEGEDIVESGVDELPATEEPPVEQQMFFF